MKKSGVCPKCGSRNISCKDLFLRGHNAGSTVVGRKISFFLSEYSQLDVYVCGECGFMETYAREPNKLVPKPKTSR